MPISYALLLCIPMGFLFFWIARSCFLYVMGRYEGPEYRASMAFGVFGVLLIPNIWTAGCLQEEFPNVPGMLVAFPLLMVVEGIVLVGLFRPFPRRGGEKSESGDRVLP
jgi:hypothetical protein